MESVDPGALLAIVIPLAAIELALWAYTLTDLLRRSSAQVNGNKWAWAAAIVLINPLGAIAYLVAGRREG
ncbi:MAG: PLDc_N domain-containing protein [Actinobacteria bacterium]|nr:PLDc_N domain-containing protein [Actinomycetota bacterium]